MKYHLWAVIILMGSFTRFDIKADPLPAEEHVNEDIRLETIQNRLESELYDLKQKLTTIHTLEKSARSPLIRRYLLAKKRLSNLKRTIRGNESVPSVQKNTTMTLESALNDIENFRYEGVLEMLRDSTESREELVKYASLFLLGRACSDRGEHIKASEYFLLMVEDNGCPCADHARHLAAKSLLEADQPPIAEKLLDGFTHGETTYPLLLDVVIELTDMYNRMNRHQNTLDLLNRMKITGEEVLFRKAQASVRLNRFSEAEELLKRLFIEYPAGKHSAESERMYLDLLSKRNLAEPELSVREVFDRAERLDKAGVREKAAGLYLFLEKKSGVPQSLKRQSLLQRAKILHDLRKNKEGLEAYENFLKKYPGDSAIPVALIRMGTIYRRLNDDENYLKMIIRIEKNHPGTQTWQEALNGRGEYYRGKNELQKAALDFEKVIKSGSGEEKAIAGWKRAWIYFDFERYPEAAASFAGIVRDQQGTGWEGPARYWQAKSLELSGKTSEADGLFLELAKVKRWQYPGISARENLAARNIAVPADWEPGTLSNLSPEELQKPGIRCGNILMAAGLYERAALEFEAAASAALTPSKGLSYLTARALALSGQVARARSVIARSFQRDIERGSAPVEVAGIYYPLPITVKEILYEYAEETAIDPLFAASLILQESGFDPSEVSENLAAGYMQLMPELFVRMTSDWTPVPDPSDRFDPENNLKAGLKYLKSLLNRYDQSKAKALAAYNAGESRVDDWRDQYPFRDEEIWIEHIPFQQTRLFAKKIHENYTCYQMIYGKIPARPSDSAEIDTQHGAERQEGKDE